MNSLLFKTRDIVIKNLLEDSRKVSPIKNLALKHEDYVYIIKNFFHAFNLNKRNINYFISIHLVPLLYSIDYYSTGSNILIFKLKSNPLVQYKVVNNHFSFLVPIMLKCLPSLADPKRNKRLMLEEFKKSKKYLTERIETFKFLKEECIEKLWCELMLTQYSM